MFIFCRIYVGVNKQYEVIKLKKKRRIFFRPIISLILNKRTLNWPNYVCSANRRQFKYLLELRMRENMYVWYWWLSLVQARFVNMISGGTRTQSNRYFLSMWFSGRMEQSCHPHDFDLFGKVILTENSHFEMPKWHFCYKSGF